MSIDQASRQRAPLEGVRIIDLTSVIMGPFATRILADFGADVIKVEPPEGDVIRSAGGTRISAPMLNLWRNKRSVVLDLKTDEGKRALAASIATADVLVHNLRPKVMARLGFTYDRVKALKPDIIYCAAHGFGAGGPYGDKPAYDDLIQAASGYAVTSVPLTGEPSYAPAILCDKLAGQAIVYAILAGLFHRERGGGGQAIEVPMFETAIDFNLVEGFGDVVYAPPRGEPGYPRVRSHERRPFRTADGFACILPYSTRNWFDFFAIVGCTAWCRDARFATAEARNRNFDTLYRMIRDEAPHRTTEQWVEVCDRHDIPCMPVLSVRELIEDRHVRAVGLIPMAEHPTEGRYYQTRPPIQFSAAPYAMRYHAPTLGEHTSEVLAEIGFEPKAAA